MTKKSWILLGVLVVNLLIISPTVISQATKPVFKYGFWGFPQTIDPAQATDSISIDIIDQVCEGLLAYDLSNPELTPVPRLATDLGTWNTEATEITFILRQDVTFHDGTPFNATCVKFSFDRLVHLIEIDESILGELYAPLAQLYSDTPLVINETVVVNEYTVKFILNYPYVPFISLLCFSGSYIVHPAIPFDHLIELNATLIGTGPYMFVNYTEDEIHFMAYQNYYRPRPDIQEMHWIRYADMITTNHALLVGDVDMINKCEYDYLWPFSPDPEHFYIAPPKPSASIDYFGMNNQVINKTWRQALSYATDYEYLIRYIMNDQAVRMTSVIPLGILYHDPTVVSVNFDLDRARQILSDAGLSQGLTAASPDELWCNIANSTTPLATFNFSYNAGNNRRADMGLMLKNNLKLLGIKLDVFALDWAIYNDILNYHPERLSIYNIRWSPEYNDPATYINSLFSNPSSSNSAQVNDPWLQQAMMDALAITNEAERREAYATIQHYLVEDLMPWVFLYTPTSKAWWNINLTYFPRNVMDKHYFYPCIWYPPTTTNTTTSTSNTFPTNPFSFISGNVKGILLALFCVPIALIFMLKKKYSPNHT